MIPLCQDSSASGKFWAQQSPTTIGARSPNAAAWHCAHCAHQRPTPTPPSQPPPMWHPLSPLHSSIPRVQRPSAHRDAQRTGGASLKPLTGNMPRATSRTTERQTKLQAMGMMMATVLAHAVSRLGGCETRGMKRVTCTDVSSSPSYMPDA